MTLDVTFNLGTDIDFAQVLTQNRVAIAEAKLPVLFHTGHSGIGTGMPGGDGIKLRDTQPLLLDDVAASFDAIHRLPGVPIAGAKVTLTLKNSQVEPVVTETRAPGAPVVTTEVRGTGQTCYQNPSNAEQRRNAR